MPSILIIGATRGLGNALLQHYSSKPSTTVYGTSRTKDTAPKPSGSHVNWIPSIDLTDPSCGTDLASGLKGLSIDAVYVTAGYFATEDFSSDPEKGINWEKELRMYTTSSIAPVFLVQALVSSSILRSGSKVVIVSSESGSITLRHEQEGGGNFGHHGSKAASNMVGKQLSFDLKNKGVAVAICHPSFMRTEMTAGVGFDKFWDDGGALKPEEAAEKMANFVDNEFDMELTGTYWAPRGTRDIGNWDAVLGKGKRVEGPVQLPW